MALLNVLLLLSMILSVSSCSPSTESFKDEMSCIEWCRRNHSKIGAINDYRTFGESISHFEIMDAINGKTR